MARKKAVKRPQPDEKDETAVQTHDTSIAYAGQVHTATLQTGRSATCNPIELGPGYASEPFSVGRFKAECQDILQQLAAHIGSAGDLMGADLDVADLRLLSLDEELAAERAEAAHATIRGQATDTDSFAADLAAAATNAATAPEAAAGAVAGQGATPSSTEGAAAACQAGVAAAGGAADGVDPANQAAAAAAPTAEAAASNGVAATHVAAAASGESDAAAAPAARQSRHDAGRGSVQDAAAEAAAVEAEPDGGGTPPRSEDQQAAGSGGGRRGTKRKQAAESLPGTSTHTPEPQSPQLRRSRRHHQPPADDMAAAAGGAQGAQAPGEGDTAAAAGDDTAGAATLTLADIEAAGRRQPAKGRRQQQRRTTKRGLGVKDMGVKFHPTVELELIERVRRRSEQRRAAAIQALTCLQAEEAVSQRGKAVAKPRRSTNYAPPPAAATDTAADTATDAAPGVAGPRPTATAAALASAAAAAGEPADAATAGEAVDTAGVVLTVALAHPANAQRVLQQWRVLGGQRLSALRDRLYCRSDLDMRAAGLGVPSGMFYIEGTFYNDMREPAAVDYSYPVRAFCHAHGLDPPACPPEAADAAGTPGGVAGSGAAERRSSRRAQPDTAPEAASDDEAAGAADASVQSPQPAGDRAPGTYECREMASTTFEKLWLRIGAGAGYVYCHQGCCEHLLAITDVRMLHPDDPQQASAYPELVYQKHSRKRRCELCERAPAVKVTYDDAYAPGNPAFWCLDCFNRMHYDKERRLVSNDFKVFDYVHD